MTLRPSSQNTWRFGGDPARTALMRHLAGPPQRSQCRPTSAAGRLQLIFRPAHGWVGSSGPGTGSSAALNRSDVSGGNFAFAKAAGTSAFSRYRRRKAGAVHHNLGRAGTATAWRTSRVLSLSCQGGGNIEAIHTVDTRDITPILDLDWSGAQRQGILAVTAAELIGHGKESKKSCV
jgi:hypothetical protein